MTNQTAYSLEERIIYWEERILSAVNELNTKTVTDIKYIECIKQIQYASKRLEILKFLQIRKEKPLSE